MMVIAKESPPNLISNTSGRGLVGTTNSMNQDQNSKTTMATASRNQLLDSSSSTWPVRRQSYGSQPITQETTQNDWQTMIACDSSNWSSGQRFYTNQDHQRQPMQEEGNFHDYLPTKYLTSNASYSSESLRLANSAKIEEPNARQTPYRVSVDNQHANHHHNYYNPITVNHVHVNYNASDSYNPTNQHRIYHMDTACNRYQQGSIYAHDNHGCNQSGAILGGPVGGGDLSSTLSSPSSASLYHTQHGHQDYAAPIRAAGQPEVGRIPFIEPNKCWQHAVHSEQACGNWISSSQYHDYAPQLNCNKPPESGSIITQTSSQQTRAPPRVLPMYECSDGAYEYYKPETIPDNLAYQQSGATTTTVCDQTYRRGSSSSSSISALPVAMECPSRGASEVGFMTGNDTKVNQSHDKLDSSRSVSNTESIAVYQEISQIQTPVQQQQQQQTTAGKDPHGSRTGSSSVSTSRSQLSTDRLNQCRICGRNYARPSTLKTHLRTHTNERPYKCAVCRKTFSQAANLTAHQRVHTGERPFPCPICGRQFSQSSSVITHLRTHSGERPYRCAMCNRRFSDSSTLTKHCRIHSGEKPYQCDYCPMNFSQSGNLSRHLRLHLMGGLSKTTSTSAAVNSDSSDRNGGPDNVVCIDSGSLAAAAANQRRHSTNLSNSSPESTLSPLI